MVTYAALVVIGFLHCGVQAADLIKIPLDDRCSIKFSVHNKSEADVEVWVDREIHYKRPDKTTFITKICSGRTLVRAGKNGTMAFYAPDCWFHHWVSKQDPTKRAPHNESKLHAYDLTYSFGGRIVQQSAEIMKITLGDDKKTLIIEPLSVENEHNSCTE